MNKFLIAACLILSVSCTLPSSSYSSQQSENRRILQEVAVQTDNCLYALFDAGSSSTKVRVYQWPCRKYSQIPDIKLIAPLVTDKGFKIKTKLSAQTQTEDSFNTYFKPAFEEIKQRLTDLQLSNVKPLLFLRATAGLRLLSVENQQTILSLVKTIFRKNTDYLFLDDEWARIISGEDEGTFLWMSVNYALKNIKPDSKVSLDLKKSSAVIDIGGASAQIAFAAQSDNNKFLDLAERNRIQIYSQTFLGYGNDEARKAILLSENRAFCFSKVTDQDNSEYQYQGGNFGGNFNFDECVNLILSFLKINGCTYPLGNSQDCSSQSTYKKLTDQSTIYGVSSIFYSMNNLFKEKSKTLTLSTFREQSKLYCETPLVKADITKNADIKNYCFQAIYTTTLLIDSFGLNKNEIIVSQEQNSFSLDWSLGSLIYDANALQCDYMDTSLCGQLDQILPSETKTVSSSSILASSLFITLCSLLILFI